MLNFFLQATTGDPTTSLLFMMAMVLVFVFLIIIPQRKQRKDQQKFTENLSKGDEVVTSNGMLGRVTKIEDQLITLDLGNKTFVRFTRNAISKQLTDAVYPPKKDK
ncbi:MAG: preprotein translocase subunit YajC [Bacteroidota bacterium]